MKDDKRHFAKQLISEPSQAAAWIQQGGLLAYPTESVWGIGCDPFNQDTVGSLLQIKARPVEKGLIVITDSISRIKPLIDCLSLTQRQQLLTTWQNGLQTQMPAHNTTMQAYTWLLPIPNHLPITIPKWITGSHNSVAVRVIAHPLIQQLCQHVVSESNPYGFIVSTSCNPSGKPPASNLEQAVAYFSDSELVHDIRYLPGDTLGYTLPSQIGDIRTGHIIR